jgi:putative peptide zinc metalloprotease protein
LALTVKAGVVPQVLVERIGRLLRVAFRPGVVLAALVSLAALDGWLFAAHGVSGQLYATARDPRALLLVVGITLVAAAFHELGHAAACSYGGARPGRIGVGLYLIWPALYTDLTDTYRLGRRGRLRADLGGVYFNALLILVLGAVYLRTGMEALVVALIVQHLQIAFQLLPLLRLDGHYVVSDLVGVPDAMSRVRPAIAALLRGRESGSGMEQFRPAVRRVVLAYGAATVLLLSAGVVLMLVRLPGIVAAVRGQLPSEVTGAVTGFEHGQVVEALSGAVGAATLALPAVGFLLFLTLLAVRIRGAAVRHGWGARSLLWPQPGLSASSLRWNVLFVLAELIPLAALLLLIRGASGAGL